MSKTMRIKVFGRFNTPEFTAGPGETIVVDRNLGKQLCDSSQAEESKESTKFEKSGPQKGKDSKEKNKPKPESKASADKKKDDKKEDPKEPEDGGAEVRGAIFDEG